MTIAVACIGSNNIGRCISVVHNRRCSAGIRQQCLVAEWLGLSVSVRVRVRARAREWNPCLLFFFFFFFVNVVDIVCCALLACIVDVTRQYDVIGHEAR